MQESRTEQRKPPAVFFVPPRIAPPSMIESAREPLAIGLIGGLVVVFVIVICGANFFSGLLYTLGAFLLILLPIVYMRRSHKQQHSVLCDTFKHERGSLAADPPTDLLQKAWKKTGLEPEICDVLNTVEKSIDQFPNDRACVICYGLGSAPDVGELQFEPEIVTPTAIVWKRLIWLPIAALFAAWISLGKTSLLPASVPSLSLSSGSAFYFLGSGIVALAIWLWFGMLRPTYYRFAPGSIQILKYCMFQSKPNITSFEMNSGTIVIAVKTREGLTIVIANEEETQEIRLHSFRNAKQVTEQAWRAILSTAPIPPLSDEELVG